MPTKGKSIPATTTRTNSGDEATKKRIRDHISNENDVITSDDIRNAKTSDLEKTPGTEGNEEQIERKLRNNDDNNIDTSWNILESE